MDPVRLPIDGILDLHTFKPREIPELIEDYIEECIKNRIYEIRIIHGKGTGFQKKRVQSILEQHQCVLSYSDAPMEAGGWGASIAVLKKP